jgi:hypothetical protein
MNQVKNICLIAAFGMAFALGPTAGWSSRVYTDRVSGEITATPISHEIEVDHHVYHVKTGSTAEKMLHGFSEGQKVDLVLDGPPGSNASQVLLITVHAAS